ncbi:MAG TPA: hypothetical protein VFU57_10590 [Candidatus Acidoferrales bacterium]|nr:hypothetical protein [Candidatus Acidoferrales bacterium]
MKRFPVVFSFAKALLVALVASFLVLSAAVAQSDNQDKKDKSADNAKDAVTALAITVVGGPKDKPVDNASVYLHWDEQRFLRRDKQMEFDLKTDMKGVAIVKGVPRRKILIQVVKNGWRPFGRYYDLNQAEQKITIKLEPPAHWY